MMDKLHCTIYLFCPTFNIANLKCFLDVIVGSLGIFTLKYGKVSFSPTICLVSIFLAYNPIETQKDFCLSICDSKITPHHLTITIETSV